jgi:hypothetical protein
LAAISRCAKKTATENITRAAAFDERDAIAGQFDFTQQM